MNTIRISSFALLVALLPALPAPMHAGSGAAPVSSSSSNDPVLTWNDIAMQAANTALGKAHLEACGFDVPAFGNLEGVTNIYDETPERAYALGRRVDRPEAQALFISGVGMPTLATQ